MVTLKEWLKKNNIPNYYEKKLIKAIKQNIDGKNWYSVIYNRIKQEYPNDYKLYLGLLAVTSQRNTLKINEKLTNKAYMLIKNNANPFILNYGVANKQIKNNIKRILDNKQPNGQKIRAYYKALTDLDLNQIVIDVWIIKVFKQKNNTGISKTDIKFIKLIIKKLAKKLCLKPAEAQACLWLYSRKKYSNNDNKTKQKTYSLCEG